jgi:protein-S-isoprenylcysteine O-methyltransferase Ste14
MPAFMNLTRACARRVPPAGRAVRAADSVLLNPFWAAVRSAAMAPLERQPSYGSTARPPARDRTEMVIGFLLAIPSALNALFYATELTMQIMRIFREERVLRKDADYRAFAARVHYRLLPGVF